MRWCLILLSLVSANVLADEIKIHPHGFCEVLGAFRDTKDPAAKGVMIPVSQRYPVVIDPSVNRSQAQLAKSFVKTDDKVIGMETEIHLLNNEGFFMLGRITVDGKEVKRGTEAKEVPSISPRRIVTTVLMSTEEAKAAGLQEYSGKELAAAGVENANEANSYIFAGFAANCTIAEPKTLGPQ